MRPAGWTADGGDLSWVSLEFWGVVRWALS